MAVEQISLEADAAEYSRRGVRWLRKLRDLSRKYHAQLSHRNTCPANGERREREEHRLRNVSWTWKFTR